MIQVLCQLRFRGFPKRDGSRADLSATMRFRIWRDPRIRKGTFEHLSEGSFSNSLLALQLLHGKPCISNFKFEISNQNEQGRQFGKMAFQAG